MRRANPNEKNSICKHIACSIFKFIEKCHDPEKLLYKLNMQAPELVALIRSNDIAELAKFMPLTRVQRLRERARARLKEHS